VHATQAKLAEEEQEARAARHRAQLLPASTDMPVVPPKPEPKPLTVPQPFALRSEVRGSRLQLEGTLKVVGPDALRLVQCVSCFPLSGPS
jgi:hypothetical protein